ncbi:hypothetical protein F5148DRAFT_1155044 [Russula earlei]|uniref:Uncharacterized protein n=1 Tax=Russula earlei TaxID=71964 RepID=A0ACC0TRV1_9AGAM|nr:hypothetical protein F5148DRAFT_1155044 [Russula earlei]
MLWQSLWLGPSWSSGVVLVMRGGDGAAVLVSHKTTTKVAGAETKAEDGVEAMMEGMAVDSGDGAMAGTSPGTVVDKVTDETEGDETTEGAGADETKVGVADEAARAEVAEAKVAGTDEVAMMVDVGDAGTVEAGGAGELKMAVVNEVTGMVDKVGTAGAMGVGDMKAMMGDAKTTVGAGVGMGGQDIGRPSGGHPGGVQARMTRCNLCSTVGSVTGTAATAGVEGQTGHGGNEGKGWSEWRGERGDEWLAVTLIALETMLHTTTLESKALWGCLKTAHGYNMREK